MDQNKTILICATPGSERDDLVNLLSGGGHQVLVAESAEDGISQAKSNQPSIVVLDLTSPTHNGYAFIETLRAEVVFAEMPTVIVLANTPEEVNQERNDTLGVKDAVMKTPTLAADVATKLLPSLGHATEADPIHSDGFKILVVEDDNFLRDLLARKLGQENCQFIAAIDGENALKLMDENKPSIVLLDLILPGIDGFEVLNKIKQNPTVKDVPVVILSNLGQDSDIQKAKELGADDFLIKANFSIDEVISKIKELVGA